MIMHFLAMGTILGLSAGLAPGPLLALVISETLQHDVKAGIKVALAPLVTDIPIVSVAIFMFARLSDLSLPTGLISIAGGCFISALGWRLLRSRGAEAPAAHAHPHSFTKGVLANALSPHPYLFWLLVGAPTVSSALKMDLLAVSAFIAGFYVCLLGAKILLALVVGRSRLFLQGRTYLYTLRSLGLLLCVLALVLFHDGLKLLGASSG